MQDSFVVRIYTSFDAPKLGFLVFFLLTLISLYMGQEVGLGDADYFWHIKAGEVIFSTGALPATDPFSYTFAGKPWVLHEWLFQVLLYLAYVYLGEHTIAVATALIPAVAWYLSYQGVRLFLPAPLVAIICVLVFAPGMFPFLTPRPHLFSYLFFALFLHVLLKAKYRNAHRGLYALPFVMVLWVNLHGGYAIGLALVLAFFLAEGASALGSGDPAYRRRALWYGTTFVTTLAASAINPDGPQRWVYPFEILGLEATRHITEWQPLSLKFLGGQIALLSGILFLVVAGYRRRRPDLLELALPVSLFLASMLSARNLVFAALTLPPFLAQAVAEGALSQMLEGPLVFLKKVAGVLGRWTDALARRLKPEPGDKGVYLVHWLVAAVAFGAVTPAIMATDWEFKRREALLPVAAVDFIEVHNLRGRMFNDYGAGGYLISRLHPGRKVFIDGRADLYGDAFFKDYLAIMRTKGDWRGLLAKWDIDYALVRTTDSIRTGLARSGSYAEVYKDDKFAVLVRRVPRFRDLIKRFATTASGDAMKGGR